MKKVIVAILMVLMVISGCRTIENTTETDSETVKTEEITSDTQSVTEKITKIEIPIHLLRQLKGFEVDTTVRTENRDTKQSKSGLEQERTDSTNNKVVITTKETTTTQKQEKIERKDVEEEKTVEKTKKEPAFMWNYLYIIIGVLILPILLKIIYSMWIKK